MAWARDRTTGEPVHILELDASRRGAKSGCDCPHCELPLTAVNAARTEFIKRPHFRHPEGAERDDCLVLAGRAAAMRQLRELGWLDLPRRTMSGQATGLSGREYTAWVEAPPERIRVTQVDFYDRASALLTLDDGRQLRVVLTGAWGAGTETAVDADGHPVPTIILALDEPALAGMSPGDLRRRLSLVPDSNCWRRHWSDGNLAEKAQAAAAREADESLDAWPEGLRLPDGLDSALRRQTLLHYEVMRILAEAGRLRVPVPGQRHDLQWRPHAHVDSEMLVLSEVRLEQRFGRIVPDVICLGKPEEGDAIASPLFIEVTVTNAMTHERLDRIRSAGQPTLEVALSLAGGRLRRDELRQLLVEELELKRWLHFPGVAPLQQTETQDGPVLSETRSTSGRSLLEGVVREFVMAVQAAAEAGAKLNGKPGDRMLRLRADTAMSVATNKGKELEAMGFEGACARDLIGHHGIIPRLLSIQLARPIGYRVDNVMGVLAAIENASGLRLAETTLYLIAVRTYRPPLTDQQQAWFEEWAGRVRSSLRNGELIYLRDPFHDRLLSLAFPEMAAALSKPSARLQSR